jgi:hypothetical protein
VNQPESPILSVDQNCNSLWDVPPKLHALEAGGYHCVQYVEDVDVAFTKVGAGYMSADLRIERERYYRTGAGDWGAGLFYSEFLGKLAVDPRQWEPLTGMTTRALARSLRMTVDEFYDRYSPGDNWQLVGSSYVGDSTHHRVLGDITCREVSDHLARLMELARADMRRAFPGRQSQAVLDQWWASQNSLAAALMERHKDGRLTDLYRDWLDSCRQRNGAPADVSSNIFALGANADQLALLEIFTKDYHTAAELYNEALAQTQSQLHPLDVEAGELPFFAVFSHKGHMVRSQVFLRDRRLHLPLKAVSLGPGGRIPVDSLQALGVQCLVGKAVLLMLQVRVGPTGGALALPHRGSLYSPAAQRLEMLLKQAGMLKSHVWPIIRVRLRLLDRLREVDTPIALGDHLAGFFGDNVIPANTLGERWSQIQSDAAWSIRQLASQRSRDQWRAEAFPELTAEINSLDATRRRLAANNADAPQMREVWKKMKPPLETLNRLTVERIQRDWQLRDLDYWDSRGAILPWCLALGGEQFYQRVIRGAQIYEEQPPGQDV